MNVRQTKKEIKWETEGENTRQFVIHKMPVLESISVLKTLLTRVLPLDLLSVLDESGNLAKGLAAIPKKDMSDEEFTEFTKRLLQNVYEKLPVGETAVIDEVGNYGVIDLEYNLTLALYLLMQVVLVNYKDFFIEILQKLGVQPELSEMPAKLIGEVINK